MQLQKEVKSNPNSPAVKKVRPQKGHSEKFKMAAKKWL